MATQEERLRAWRSAAGEVIESSARRRRKRQKPSQTSKPTPYRDRLIESAEKGIAQHDAWLGSSTGYLDPEGDEETFRFRQEQIARSVPIGAAKKAFNLDLPELGPYKIDYSPNGRYLLIGGSKGHLAQFDWQTGKLLNEIQVYETVRDVQFLHNHLYWAAAQKKYVFVYDNQGIELHRLKSMHEPYRLQFLRHHFLLCSVGNVGVLTWQDTTSGQLVASIPTKKGCCRVMEQNPSNAVLCLGHSFGSVTMWTPNMQSPVAQIKTCKTPVASMAVDPSGRYLVVGGTERIIKVWDIRKFEELHCYFTSKTPDALTVSQTGLLSVGYGTRIEVWKDALIEKQSKPYLVHRCTGSRIHDLKFCPYEDVLGVGHATGLCSMLVPGSGEANYDTFVDDPYQTKKGRRESEIARMMDKLPSDLIVLDPDDVREIRKKNEEDGIGDRSEEESDKETARPPMQSKVKQELDAVKAGLNVKVKKRRKQAPADVPFALRRFYD